MRQCAVLKQNKSDNGEHIITTRNGNISIADWRQDITDNVMNGKLAFRRSWVSKHAPFYEAYDQHLADSDVFEKVPKDEMWKLAPEMHSFLQRTFVSTDPVRSGYYKVERWNNFELADGTAEEWYNYQLPAPDELKVLDVNQAALFNSIGGYPLPPTVEPDPDEPTRPVVFRHRRNSLQVRDAGPVGTIAPVPAPAALPGVYDAHSLSMTRRSRTGRRAPETVAPASSNS